MHSIVLKYYLNINKETLTNDHIPILNHPLPDMITVLTLIIVLSSFAVSSVPVSPIILCGPLPLCVLCCVQESKQTKRILLLLLELDRPGPAGPGSAVCTTEFFVRHKAFVGPECL